MPSDFLSQNDFYSLSTPQQKSMSSKRTRRMNDSSSSIIFSADVFCEKDADSSSSEYNRHADFTNQTLIGGCCGNRLHWHSKNNQSDSQNKKKKCHDSRRGSQRCRIHRPSLLPFTSSLIIFSCILLSFLNCLDNSGDGNTTGEFTKPFLFVTSLTIPFWITNPSKLRQPTRSTFSKNGRNHVFQLYSSSSTSSSSSSSIKTAATTTNTSTSSMINIQKQQYKNELTLQSFMRKGKTQDALSFYYSIYDDYYQNNNNSDYNNNHDDDDKIENRSNAKGMVSPTVRLMNYAIDACARAKPYPYTNEAMSIFTKATTTANNKDVSSSPSSSSRIKKKQLIPNVYTFGSLIRSYARIGDVHKCINIVNEMKETYGIQPNSVIYSTIISACEHVHHKSQMVDDTINNGGSNMRKKKKSPVRNENVDVKLALQLFQEATNNVPEQSSTTTTTTTSDTNNKKKPKRNDSSKDMNIVVYNTVLSVFAKGGEWKLACQLLDEMEEANNKNSVDNDIHVNTTSKVEEVSSRTNNNNNNNIKKRKRIVSSKANIPPPDNITYGTVMAACERSKQWHVVLQIANRLKHSHHSTNSNKKLDVMSLSSALKACQQLGLADEALQYLNQMKELKNYDEMNNSNVNNVKHKENRTRSNRKHERKSYQGPDDVAYRLAISACARAGYMSNMKNNEYEFSSGDSSSGSSSIDIDASNANGNESPRWIDGVRLLREMEEVTGSAPDVIAYTAAIGGCAVAGEYIRAIQLLKEMKKKGVQPNTITFTAVISACASACAKKSSNSEIDGSAISMNSGILTSFDDESNQEGDDTFIKAAAMKAALSILQHMTRKNAPKEIQPNIVTYNAAIRACAEGLDISKAFALLDELKSRNLQPTIVTYGTLMTACERVGDVNGATKIFRLMREEEEDMKPNEIIYGAAISCFRKASQSERTLRLLQKMLNENLTPNTATFNTVLMSQMEAKNTKSVLTVYNMMSPSSFSRNTKIGRPNRQTYNMLIRYMAMNLEPANAEYFLKQMSENGMKPDVDLFTLTVTAYEKNIEPRKALSLMESMREEGYDFYDIKALDFAFKQASIFFILFLSFSVIDFSLICTINQ